MRIWVEVFKSNDLLNYRFLTAARMPADLLTQGVVNTYPGVMACQDPLNSNATTSRTTLSGAPLRTTDWTVDGIPNTQSSNADYGIGMSN